MLFYCRNLLQGLEVCKAADTHSNEAAQWVQPRKRDPCENESPELTVITALVLIIIYANLPVAATEPLPIIFGKKLTIKSYIS